MGVQERPFDRGTRRAREAIARTGRELRIARRSRGLSIDTVAASLGASNAEVSRIERDLAPNVPAVRLFQFGALVGLDVAMTAYAGPSSLRDAPSASLLADFAARLNAAVRWGAEVPLPIAGDQRAWDGMASGAGWRYGVEAESAPNDAQALVRRLALKERDGDVDGVILVLRPTRRVRAFLREAAPVLSPFFRVSGVDALARLAAGNDPGGSAIVLIPRRRTDSRAT